MKATIKFFLLTTTLLFAFALASAYAGNFTVLHSFGSSNKITGSFPSAMLTQSPQGTLYGIDGSGTTLYYTGTQYRTAQQADSSVYGAIFAVNPDGTGFKTLHIFTNTLDGSNGAGSMVLVGDTLYGTTRGGGAYYGGTVFRINTNGSAFTHLYDFGGVTNDALNPTGSLIHSNGILYGTTLNGGQYGLGTVFSINVTGGAPSNLVNFSGTNGAQPWAGLTLASNTLFGSTRAGNSGLFKVNINGSGFSVVAGGIRFINPLFLTNNVMYGAAEDGSIFSVNTDGSGFTTIFTLPPATTRNPAGAFTNSDGYNPLCVVVVSNQIYGIAGNGGTNGCGTVFSANTNGSSFSVLHTLEPTSLLPYGTMLLGDRIYGTMSTGGHGYGFLFSLNLDGSGYTNFFNFGTSDGFNPSGPLTVNNGYLYGATTFGGTSGYGMVYRIGTNGTGYTNVHDFSGIDTSQPVSGFAIRSNVLYGSTASSWNNTGAIFSMRTDGSNYSILRYLKSSFTSSSALVNVGDKIFGGGFTPGPSEVFTFDASGQNFTNRSITLGSISSLVMSGDLVYGMRSGFGLYLYALGSSDLSSSDLFAFPSGATDYLYPPTLMGDTFYGISLTGGSYGKGSVYSINTNGLNFSVLHSFSGPEGQNPHGILALANGVLYGTTGTGGDYNYGTIFSINIDGSGFAVHHSFTGGRDGGLTSSSLQVSGKTLYGTTPIGGDMNAGTLFALAIEPTLTSQISGNNLVLSWCDPSFSLQSAPTPAGNFTTISGSTSPYTNIISTNQQYFRLISN